MGATLLGVLPVSAVNVGAALQVPVLSAKLGQVQAQASKLLEALAVQAQFDALTSPLPDVVGFAAALTAWPTNVLQALAALATPGVTADLQADISLDLGALELQAALLGELRAQVALGLGASGISAWAYSGRAEWMGQQLGVLTRNGFAGLAAGEQVQGAFIVTESPETWGAFSATFNTGTTATARPTSQDASLAALGSLSAGALNLGALDVVQPLDVLLLDVRGRKAQLEATLQLTLGVNLPSPEALLASFAPPAFEALLPALTFRLDLQANLNAVLNLATAITADIAQLQLVLGAGGLALWAYSGPAGSLGDAVADALAGGVPGGTGAAAPVYGMALAGRGADWGAFRALFGA